MNKAILLALMAGIFTAVSSICQRRGALRVPPDDHLRVKLILHLLGEPVWLLGVGSMILGFVCQASALHFGSLALVQPILATELLFVFAYLAMASSRRVRWADWLAAGAMAGGLGVFLFAADPSGGRASAPASMWLIAGSSAFGLVVLLTMAAYTPLHRGRPSSPGRRAALLGAATGVSWGFLAAVIKEAASHTSHGLTGLLSTWSPYVLVVVGAASLVLSSNALQAGPLPASQPGFTIIDPLVASLVGIFVFRDHLRLDPVDLGMEIVALVVLVLGVVALSGSALVHGEPARSETGSPLDASLEPRR